MMTILYCVCFYGMKCENGSLYGNCTLYSVSVMLTIELVGFGSVLGCWWSAWVRKTVQNLHFSLRRVGLAQARHAGTHVLTSLEVLAQAISFGFKWLIPSLRRMGFA